MTVLMDVSLLRRALRLVHCLQKERGASCAVCAASDNGSHEGCVFQFQAAMTSARGDTDIAASRLYRDMNMPPAAAALDKIRSQIGVVVSSSSDTISSRTSVHRMLVIFNTLISNVVHEYILQYLQQSRDNNNNDDDGRRRRGGRITYCRQRSNTYDGILFQEHATTFQASASAHHRYQSDNLVPEFLLPHRHAPPSVGSMPSSFTFSKPMSDPYAFMEHGTTTTNPPTKITVSTPPARFTHSQSSRNTTFLNKHEDRTESLVNLLGCLVRLKESTGMQRAVISSMTSIDGGRDFFAQMQVTTLILEVENQRKLVAELQQLPMFDYSLQKLVQDSIQMGTQMETLHTKILNDFDVQDDEMNSNDVWNMITVYIDKLHALELLLVEELEYCVEFKHVEVQDQTCTGVKQQQEDEQVLKRILGKELHEMSPEEIKKKLVEFMGNNNNGDGDDTVQVLPGPPLPQLLSDALQLPTIESAKEWQISLDELQFKKRIGRGTAGTTYLAKWSGQTVAVKVACLNDMGLEGWQTEVQSLQKLHHPNVIRLLGSVYNENPLTYCLVLEFCNAGDLSAALLLPTPHNFFFCVASDIASGLAYLHRRGVLHRDIKPSNVLLDGNVRDGRFRAKVSDFGLSTTSFDGGNDDANKTAETGTYRWMAPEIIRHEPYSIEADVYSFAILCWQLVTRENPFGNHVSPLEAAGKVALELARPLFPPETPLGIQELITACWLEEPSSRLPVQEVLTLLVELETLVLTPEEITWLQAPMGHAVYQTRTIQKSSSPLPPLVVVVPPRLGAKHKEKKGGGLRAIFGHRSGPSLKHDHH